MNEKRYKWILYIIVVVTACTIAIQVYWNYKNYLISKQQFINDVQVSLDNAVDAYYADLAHENTLAFAFDFNEDEDHIIENQNLGRFIQNIDTLSKGITNKDSLSINIYEDISVYRETKSDSFIEIIKNNKKEKDWLAKKVFIKAPNLSKGDFEMLTSKVIVSITNDSLRLEKIDALLKSELNRKHLNINYGLSFKNILDSIQRLNQIDKAPLNTTSKSIYLPKGSTLKVHFNNETKTILKRILSGILISILLVLAVISCLFYLLSIIKRQKQLAEVKNDLISNITHEFKTPIATISVALESIKNFNVIDNKEKTKTYLEMSNTQLSKLNVMVEKLLETATLDSDSLILVKEKINITDLISSIIDKHQLQTEPKTINFNTSIENIFAHVDLFHFENAINNIIDNAIKYGGQIISIDVSQNSFSFTVSISDNGNTITKAQKDKIFEKFYRVTKGNTHDVKGFGIGLYYAKKIIEKHGGAIHLDLNNNLTTFNLSLPNE